MRARDSRSAGRPGGTLAVGAVCLILSWLGTPAPGELPAAHAQPGSQAPKMLVIGFDGMDPDLLNQFRSQGLMPHFDRLIAAGDYKPLGTTIPPASPVAWAGFITGQDAGGHGIFDFFHRDPETLIPFLSVGDAQEPTKWFRIGHWKFPRDGGGAKLLRKGAAFWEFMADAGIDVTIFKVPSNFPPVECEARSLSGMGTPDIVGTYGIFSYITDHPPADADYGGGRMIPVEFVDDRCQFELPGPTNSYREGDPPSARTVEIVIDPVHPAATFKVGDETFLLQEGEWSDWAGLSYEMIPVLKSVSGICRFYLMELRPHFRLYITPVQIDPEHPEMPISTPDDYASKIAEDLGLYYTQGMPDDTRALDEGVFGDDDYISQSNLVIDERITQLRYELEHFRQLDSGFLFFYFNSPDQTCHMLWRNMDPESPLHDEAHGRHADRIQQTYQRCDEALGLVLEACDDDVLIMAISDHGFAPFHRAFNLNTWLYRNGYIHLRPGKTNRDVKYLRGIDWSRTRAYAFGINSLYINLAGRERRGIVRKGAEQEELLQELVTKLEAVVDDATGQAVIKYAYRTDEIYHGPERETGPDMMIGYHRTFRGSNDSALGGIPDEIIEDNLLKWSGDHLIAADEVPGIIVTNRRITKDNPSLLDLAPTILRVYGLEPTPEMRGSNIFAVKGES